MADTLTPRDRSARMARVRHKDTKPEMLIRRGLHARGFRFRLHRKDLPGKPDLTLARYQAVIEVRGCFWHGHEGCGRRPKSREAFWNEKIDGNRARNARNEEQLLAMGWRVLVIWECAMVGPGRLSADELLDRAAAWLEGHANQGVIAGTPPA
ncbi:hypothetical protein BKI51_02555 [Alphaproteobacteria bacterium AO1-B]|nr:hypothetical protein BKI51_02555 [Alphaproteobacteria bacterium AO1-B]